MKNRRNIKMIISLLFLIISTLSCEKQPMKQCGPNIAKIAIEIVDLRGNNLMKGIRYYGEHTEYMCSVASSDYSSPNDTELSTIPQNDPQIAYITTDVYGLIPYEATAIIVCNHIFNDVKEHRIIIKGDDRSTHDNYISKSVIFEGKEYPTTVVDNDRYCKYHVKIVLDR